VSCGPCTNSENARCRSSPLGLKRVWATQPLSSNADRGRLDQPRAARFIGVRHLQGRAAQGRSQEKLLGAHATSRGTPPTLTAGPGCHNLVGGHFNSLDPGGDGPRGLSGMYSVLMQNATENAIKSNGAKIVQHLKYGAAQSRDAANDAT